jgi:hypothetical protein
MATSNQSENVESSFGYSVARSLVTQYWMFTLYVLAYMTVGAAFGAYVNDFSLRLYGMMALALWLGLEGLHAVDLSHQNVALRTHPTVSRYLGYSQVVIAGAIGVEIASMTSWYFLAFVGAALFFGLAYNEEWFDGALHDDNRLTGLLNFGFAWGVIPVLGGFFIMAQTIHPAMIVVALAVMFDALRVILLFESGKPAPYDDLDILYARNYGDNLSMVRSATHTANKLNMISWVLLAVGFVWLFVV